LTPALAGDFVLCYNNFWIGSSFSWR